MDFLPDCWCDCTEISLKHSEIEFIFYIGAVGLMWEKESWVGDDRRERVYSKKKSE